MLEVLMAMGLLSVGLLTIAFAFAQNLAATSEAQQETIARQKARETIESVVTALDSQTVTFAQICNLSQGSACVFVDGFTPLYDDGADGIYGTADDSMAGVQVIYDPGPDHILGTTDDIAVPLNNFQRKVLVTPLANNLKQVQVTVQYTTSRFVRSVTLSTYVTPYT